ncbi:hypothetical protein DSECCO2_592390 [anaerobic digester metagenome]
MRAAIFVHFCGSVLELAMRRSRTQRNSLLSVSRANRDGSFSTFTPSCTRSVASPPSSTMRSGPEPSGQVRAISVHHQYSSRLSPFQAKTLASPSATTAAAAWSWVEKMLQDAQRTSAPRALRVLMSMAVWMVMCRLPVTRRPLRGLASPYLSISAMSPGISRSDSCISLLPHSARAMSATL